MPGISPSRYPPGRVPGPGEAQGGCAVPLRQRPQTQQQREGGESGGGAAGQLRCQRTAGQGQAEPAGGATVALAEVRRGVAHGHGPGLRVSRVKVQWLVLLPHIKKVLGSNPGVGRMVEFTWVSSGCSSFHRQPCEVNTHAGALDQGNWPAASNGFNAEITFRFIVLVK